MSVLLSVFPNSVFTDFVSRKQFRSKESLDFCHKQPNYTLPCLCNSRLFKQFKNSNDSENFTSIWTGIVGVSKKLSTESGKRLYLTFY